MTHFCTFDGSNFFFTILIDEVLDELLHLFSNVLNVRVMIDKYDSFAPLITCDNCQRQVHLRNSHKSSNKGREERIWLFGALYLLETLGSRSPVESLSQDLFVRELSSFGLSSF
jgi:hypothetical protein